MMGKVVVKRAVVRIMVNRELWEVVHKGGVEAGDDGGGENIGDGDCKMGWLMLKGFLVMDRQTKRHLRLYRLRQIRWISRDHIELYKRARLIHLVWRNLYSCFCNWKVILNVIAEEKFYEENFWIKSVKWIFYLNTQSLCFSQFFSSFCFVVLLLLLLPHSPIIMK